MRNQPEPTTSPSPAATKTPAAAPELVCTATSLAALSAAVEAGADAVSVEALDRADLTAAVRLAHERGVRLLLTLDEPRPSALDQAVALGVDAVVAHDLELFAYAAQAHPGLALHLAAEPETATPAVIAACAASLGVRRLVLPRTPAVAALTELAHAVAPVGIEVPVYGGNGAEATALDVVAMLPGLAAAGAAAFRIDARQRGQAHVAALVRSFRRALEIIGSRGLPPPRKVG